MFNAIALERRFALGFEGKDFPSPANVVQCGVKPSLAGRGYYRLEVVCAVPQWIGFCSEHVVFP